jgi:tetratricopeptide (TPR) repeat protein
MKRSASSLAALLCLIFAAHLSAPAQQKTATPKERETWRSVRSENFFLVGNAGEKEIRQVALRLERFRDGLTRFFSGANLSPAVPTRVLVFRTDESYRPFKPLYDGAPSNVAGYFQGSPDLNYITITIDGNTLRPFGTVFHEYVHLFVENNLRGLPLCLNEGLAEYFSTFESADGGRRAIVGKSNDYHLRILRTREWLPLSELLEADSRSAIYNERAQRDMFYAESWALAHYLILGRNGERQSDFYRFAERMAEGAPVLESFRETFKADPSAIEEELKEYVTRDKRPAQAMRFDKASGIKDEEMASAVITEAEAQYYLGDLLLHTNRLEEAASYLKEALRLNPELAPAHASLGMVRVRERRFAEAIPALRRAVELAPGNYLAHYYYAYGLSRQGMNEESVVMGYEPEAAGIMRAELLRAIELAPSYPESYHLLAFVNLATGEQLEQAETLLREAMRIAPSRAEFALVLAQIYERRREWAKARETLDPLRRSRNAQLRVRAEQMLKTLAATESEIARLEARGILVPDANDKSGSSSVSVNAQKPRIVKRFAGERVRGLLTNVECDNGDAVLTLRDGERLLHFRSDNLRRITFVAYVEGMGRSITCGQRDPASLVLLTYRPVGNTGGQQFDGEAVAIEFVSEDMEFEP